MYSVVLGVILVPASINSPASWTCVKKPFSVKLSLNALYIAFVLFVKLLTADNEPRNVATAFCVVVADELALVCPVLILPPNADTELNDVSDAEPKSNLTPAADTVNELVSVALLRSIVPSQDTLKLLVSVCASKA